MNVKKFTLNANIILYYTTDKRKIRCCEKSGIPNYST